MTAAFTRQNPRLPIRLSAELRVDGKTVTATTRNLSTGGVCLAGDFSLREGTFLFVGLFLVVDDVEDATNPPLEIAGRVAWTTSDAESGSLLGVRFEKVSPLQLNGLLRYLKVVGAD